MVRALLEDELDHVLLTCFEDVETGDPEVTQGKSIFIRLVR